MQVIIFMLVSARVRPRDASRSSWGCHMLVRETVNPGEKKATFRGRTHYPNTLAQKSYHPLRGDLGKLKACRRGTALHTSPLGDEEQTGRPPPFPVLPAPSELLPENVMGRPITLRRIKRALPAKGA